MARYRGPQSKIARRFNEPIFGPDKALEREKLMVLVSMEIIEDQRNLNMLVNWLKNKKLSILMVY